MRRLGLLGLVLAVAGCARCGTPPVPPPSAPALAELGSLNGCLLREGRLSCWGYNRDGQLGDGTTTSRQAPAPVEGLTGVRAVSMAGASSCALTADGQVFCWGSNTTGQGGAGPLGTGSAKPRRVEGLPPAVEVAVGGDHACARTATGQVRCWGCDLAGQLGDGRSAALLGLDAPDLVSRLSVTEPVPVAGLPAATQLALGTAGTCNAHSCALTLDGEVYCWGENRWGQLGDGSAPPAQLPCVRPTPARVPGLSQIRQLAAGGGHTCALRADGRVFCWGSNDAGQLGDGTTLQRRSPVEVQGLTGVEALALGGQHSCALAHGAASCWGANDDGQLGTGDQRPRTAPARVEGLGDVRQLAADCCNTCALDRGDQLWCWGRVPQGPYFRPSAQAQTRPSRRGAR